VDAEAFPAFGWALGFEAGPGELTVRPDGLPWTLQLVALAILWAAALWAVRRRPEEIAMRPPDVAARRASMPRQPTGVSST
jgi:hypothetical protein